MHLPRLVAYWRTYRPARKRSISLQTPVSENPAVVACPPDGEYMRARGDDPVATARRWRRPERLYDLLAPLARLVVWLLADLRVIGAERVPARGGVLLAANHVSFLDPIVLVVALYDCGRRKVRFLALADLFDQPLVGWVLRGTQMIPVARGRGVGRMADDACAALEAGQAVLVYPEGTIVPPGQTRPARPGAGLLALRTSVPVLPIASQGVEGPRRRRLPPLRRRVSVVIGPPVDLSPWRGRLDRQAQLEASAAMLASVQALRPNPQGC
jgi:1-acyl-sn-glycerol-3-phosphate acyltransferase